MDMVQSISAVTDANHVFLGVSTGMRDELITQLRQLSENTGARLLALTEVDYADPQDQFAAQVIRKIGQVESS